MNLPFLITLTLVTGPVWPISVLRSTFYVLSYTLIEQSSEPVIRRCLERILDKTNVLILPVWPD